MRTITRVDYFHDPDAPRANSLVVGTSAVAVDSSGNVLLQRRSDNGNWALPGGEMDIGESIAQAIAREVHEETGFEVEIERVVGIYSDPGHVFAYDDGEVRQEFSVCFACRIVGGSLRASPESTDVGFFDPKAIGELQMHASIRVRLGDYFERKDPAIR